MGNFIIHSSILLTGPGRLATIYKIAPQVLSVGGMGVCIKSQWPVLLLIAISLTLTPRVNASWLPQFLRSSSSSSSSRSGSGGDVHRTVGDRNPSQDPLNIHTEQTEEGKDTVLQLGETAPVSNDSKHSNQFPDTILAHKPLPDDFDWEMIPEVSLSELETDTKQESSDARDSQEDRQSQPQGLSSIKVLSTSLIVDYDGGGGSGRSGHTQSAASPKALSKKASSSPPKFTLVIHEEYSGENWQPVPDLADDAHKGAEETDFEGSKFVLSANVHHAQEGDISTSGDLPRDMETVSNVAQETFSKEALQQREEDKKSPQRKNKAFKKELQTSSLEEAKEEHNPSPMTSTRAMPVAPIRPCQSRYDPSRRCRSISCPESRWLQNVEIPKSRLVVLLNSLRESNSAVPEDSEKPMNLDSGIPEQDLNPSSDSDSIDLDELIRVGVEQLRLNDDGSSQSQEHSKSDTPDYELTSHQRHQSSDRSADSDDESAALESTDPDALQTALNSLSQLGAQRYDLEDPPDSSSSTSDQHALYLGDDQYSSLINMLENTKMIYASQDSQGSTSSPKESPETSSSSPRSPDRFESPFLPPDYHAGRKSRSPQREHLGSPNPSSPSLFPNALGSAKTHLSPKTRPKQHDPNSSVDLFIERDLSPSPPYSCADRETIQESDSDASFFSVAADPTRADISSGTLEVLERECKIPEGKDHLQCESIESLIKKLNEETTSHSPRPQTPRPTLHLGDILQLSDEDDEEETEGKEGREGKKDEGENKGLEDAPSKEPVHEHGSGKTIHSTRDNFLDSSNLIVDKNGLLRNSDGDVVIEIHEETVDDEEPLLPNFPQEDAKEKQKVPPSSGVEHPISSELTSADSLQPRSNTGALILSPFLWPQRYGTFPLLYGVGGNLLPLPWSSNLRFVYCCLYRWHLANEARSRGGTGATPPIRTDNPASLDNTSNDSDSSEDLKLD